MNRPPLPLELLIPEHARRDRVSVETHKAFRQSITPPAPDPWDEIDLAVGDAERHLSPRSEREANSVLRILDQLQTGRGK